MAFMMARSREPTVGFDDVAIETEQRRTTVNFRIKPALQRAKCALREQRAKLAKRRWQSTRA